MVITLSVIDILLILWHLSLVVVIIIADRFIKKWKGDRNGKVTGNMSWLLFGQICLLMLIAAILYKAVDDTKGGNDDKD